MHRNIVHSHVLKYLDKPFSSQRLTSTTKQAMEYHQLSSQWIVEPTYLQCPESTIRTSLGRTPSFSGDDKEPPCRTLADVDDPEINANSGGLKKRFIIQLPIADILVLVEHSAEPPLEITIRDGLENSSAKSVEK